MDNNRPKDPMIKFRSVMRGKNSKGGDRFQLYLSQEDAGTLLTCINENIENPKGVKLDLHISKKEYEGRTFDSAIAFVKAVQDMAATGKGPSKFKPVPKMSQDEMAKKMAALKAAQVKE